MAANLEAVCDVCSQPVDSPGGYLLVTRQVIASPGYWHSYFEHNAAQFNMLGIYTFQAFLQNQELRQNVARTICGQKTPWLVCENCIALFEADHSSVRQHAQKWWQSGKKIQPPGTGPAPLSAVRMQPEPEKKKSRGALGGLLGPLRAKQLWSQIEKDLAHKERQTGVARCTELLGLMDERATSPSIGNVFCARANYHLAMDEYQQAVDDFASAADFYRRNNRGADVYFMEGKMRLTHALQLEERTPVTSPLRARLQELRQHHLSLSIRPSQEQFYALLEGLEDDDPQVCAYANKLVADLPFSSKNEYKQWTANFYRERINSRPKSAALAGRMLGRMLFPAPHDTYPAEIGKLKYGTPLGFVNATCAHCGYLNLGIPVPPQGVYAPLYSKKIPEGDCQAPAICDRCNQLFYLAW